MLAPFRPKIHRLPTLLVLSVGLIVSGCGSDKGVAPSSNSLSSSNAPPIQIRSDAATFGAYGSTRLDAVRLEGRILHLWVSHSGGCSPSSYAAAAPPRFLESMPPVLDLYVRQDHAVDPCLAIVNEEPTFDVRPAVELYRSIYGESAPFYLRITAQGTTEPTQILVR